MAAEGCNFIDISDDEEEPQYPPDYDFEDLDRPTSDRSPKQPQSLSVQNFDDSDDEYAESEPLPGVYFYPDDEDDIDEMIMLEGYGDSEEVTELVVDDYVQGYRDSKIERDFFYKADNAHVLDQHSLSGFYYESCNEEDSVNQV